MAKRGGSGKSSFQDLCVLPDPSKDSWTVFERRLLEGKSHLLALRPADAEAVTNFMIVMQLHTFIKQGTLLPDEKYREAYRLVLDGMEQELDAPGQLGPLSLAKMKEVGAQLQVTLQSHSLSEVPPKIAAANKQISLEARVRRLEAGGGGKPPDKPPPDKTTSAAFVIQICRISRPIYSGIRKYRSRSLAWTLHVIFPPPQPNSQIITSALYIPSGSNKSLQVSSEPYD
jgi:hypothetical protein